MTESVNLNGETYYSVEYTIKILGISESTLKQYRGDKKVKGIRIGDVYFYKKTSVETYKKRKSKASGKVSPVEINGKHFPSRTAAAKYIGVSINQLANYFLVQKKIIEMEKLNDGRKTTV
ncbi:helix-turn-helix domain-containing protein [Lactococcus lactis]|uniref:Helix-turn-helix domain-containing protein n=1 Tax=Lactococcus lactis TaxID=1358 RepID=A0AAP4DTM0_9LACT|nr:helix-turn-helix domain-containing protein [Lactococcus lactis]MDG4976080.1 helix-turn-helix domain-containing protein [Lactococcus lactis]